MREALESKEHFVQKTDFFMGGNLIAVGEEIADRSFSQIINIHHTNECFCNERRIVCSKYAY